MKNVLILFFVFFTLSVFAQPEIVESQKSMSKGTNNSYTLLLPETSKKVASDQWNAYIKTFKGKKTKNSKNETFTDNAKIASLSDNTIDVYARFLDLESEKATEVTLWLDLGGAYMNSESQSEKVSNMEQFIMAYFKKVQVFNATEYLKIQESNLKDLEKEWTKLLRDKDSYLKKIEDARMLIAKNENLISENESAQIAKVAEVESQKTNVKQAKAALQKVQ